MFIFLFITFFFLIHTLVIWWFCNNTKGISFNLFAKFLPLLLTILFPLLYTYANYYDKIFLQTVLFAYLGALFYALILVCFAIILVFILKKLHIKLPFSLGWGTLVVWLMIVIIGMYTASQDPTITKITLDAPKLKQDKKIVLVSDTHFGVAVTPKRAENLRAIIENIQPDLVVFTGDIFDTDFSHSIPYTKILSKILPNKKFGVLGNHEYYNSVSDNILSFANADITLLRNNSIIFDDINIIGVNDIRQAHISKEKFQDILQKEIKQNYFNLLLSHTPLYFKEASNLGVDLMLSGHTHNGQIWPVKLIVSLIFPYVYGQFNEGKANLFVTSGTYFWDPPLRFLTKNEIVLITLKGQKN